MKVEISNPFIPTKDGLVYLASPYSSKDPAVMQQRADKVSAVNAKLLHKGYMVYSPVAHCHPLLEHAKLGADFKFWERFNLTMLEACKQVWILMLPGWNQSFGVGREMRHAASKNIPVLFVNPDTLEVD